MYETTSVFDVLASDDTDRRVASRQALALSHTRVENRLGAYLRAAVGNEEFEARLAAVQDDMGSYVAEACTECGHDHPEHIVASLVDHYQRTRRWQPRGAATVAPLAKTAAPYDGMDLGPGASELNAEGQPVDLQRTGPFNWNAASPEEQCQQFQNLDQQFGTRPGDPLHHDFRCPVHGTHGGQQQEVDPYYQDYRSDPSMDPYSPEKDYYHQGSERGSEQGESDSDVCPNCHGKQTVEGHVCPRCGGSGLASTKSRSASEQSDSDMVTCPECGGTKKTANGEKCPKCSGHGKVPNFGDSMLDHVARKIAEQSGNTDLGEPETPINKNRWTPQSVKEIDVPSKQHPTERKDVTEPIPRANRDQPGHELSEIGEQTTEHVDLPSAKPTDHGFYDGGETSGPHTKTFPKGDQADPVTDKTP